MFYFGEVPLQANRYMPSIKELYEINFCSCLAHQKTGLWMLRPTIGIMDKLDSDNYTKPEQARAEKAMQDIVQATKDLVALDKAAELTSRGLTAKSGYSTGTIFRYFKKLDDLFVLVMVRRRREMLDVLATHISMHPPHEDIHVLARTIVHNAIDTWRNTISKRMFAIFIRQYFKRASEPEKFMVIGELLVEPLLQVQRDDQTNTIKLMQGDELRLAIRCIQTAINSPMLEGSDFAGTEEHKRIATQIAVKLFKKD